MKKLIKASTISKKDFSRIKKFLPSPDPHLPTKGKVISVSQPDLRGNEKKYLLECLASSWISSRGDFVERFEEAFAKKVSQTKYALATSSGTTALHLALASLGVGKGDEVILPTFTMIATANAVTYLGAKPVLVDASFSSWNMDVAKIEEKISPKTKAIIVVHIYGSPVEMEKVWFLAKKYNLWIVEDAAEAHGAEYKGKRAGNLGDVAAFSFYANKVITTGEGGMVTTNNPKIAERIEFLRNHAFDPQQHFWHKFLGYGYKMTSLQAAVGVAQTERFEEMVEKRRKNTKLYTKRLSSVRGLILAKEQPGTKNIFWMYSVLVEKDFALARDDLRFYLAKKGIETRSFFIPIHLQPIYFNQFVSQKFPISEELCQKGMCLPQGSKLTTKEIEFICQQIKKASKK